MHHIWLLTPRGRTSERKPRRPENPTGKGGVGGKLNGCWGQGTGAEDKERVLGTRNGCWGQGTGAGDKERVMSLQGYVTHLTAG